MQAYIYPPLSVETHNQFLGWKSPHFNNSQVQDAQEGHPEVFPQLQCCGPYSGEIC